jgi:multiple sugar transport system substrate-binding protein
MKTKLKGITWNHSRGFVPVVATAQRFEELHPDVEISWEKRSLQEFADAPVDALAERYDLLVIDHPWAGFAAARQVLVPLERHLPAAFLADQAANSVGLSHQSYNFGGVQSALAIDAAAPVASFREDLLEALDTAVPDTWEALIRLAKRGAVAFPAIPIDSLMNFLMLCVNLGEEPCVGPEEAVSREIGKAALEHLRELASYCSRGIFQWNPIRLYEAMSARDDIAYCPFAYGYSNYSRRGYARKPIRFTEPAAIGGQGPMRTTLGGTGIAVSAASRHIDFALAYIMFTADPEIQRTIYADNGGQPGHRAAWLDEELNRRTCDYFRATLPALDRAYLRPTYDGYMHFQDHAGDLVRNYMMNGGDIDAVLDGMNRLYRESRKGAAT